MLTKYYKGHRMIFSLDKKKNNRTDGHKHVVTVGNRKFWSLWSAMQYINKEVNK